MIFYKMSLLLLLTTLSCGDDSRRQKLLKRFALEVYNTYKDIAMRCIDSKLYSKRFLVDNIIKFRDNSTTATEVNKRFSKNRKYIANLVNSPKFNEMLAVDLKKIQNDYVEKIKFCLNR